MNFSETLDLASKVQDLKDSISQVNLLDTVHVNANVHSRILRLILEYKKNGRLPLYESFLRMDKISSILPKDFSAESPLFFNERNRVDLLIEGGGNAYAIVIENKIYNALDQDRQMERYLTSCIGRGFKKERLFALYLTADGTKTISKDSLTDTAKEILGVSKDTAGRFSEISFRYDILPWLRNAIRDCANDEEQIRSALIQYADYLSGMFGERDKESEKDLALTQLLAEYKISTVSSFCESIASVDLLSEELKRRRDRYCSFLAMRFISGPLKDYCASKGIELIHESYSYGYLKIKMSLPGISKASYCFNTEGDGRNIYGIINRDVQDGELLPQSAQRQLEDSGFKRSPWWPAYRYPDANNRQFARTGSADFWEICVPDVFSQFVIDTYEEVEKLISV